MKKTYLLTIFVLLINRLIGQFNPSSYPEKIKTLNKICFYSSKIFWVNCDPNTLLTKDGGKNFFKVVSPGNFNNAVAVNDSTLIVSFYDQIKLSNDRGNNWIQKYLINDLGDTIKKQNFYDFYIYKNGKGFITNYTYKEIPKVYITNNWGNTWNLADTTKYNFTPRDNKANNYIKKQYNFDSISYAIKQSSDSILIKYMNYGDTATEINLAEKGISQKVISIVFKDENNGMILTSNSSSQLQKLYFTSDGCKTFTEITKPIENFLKIEYAEAVNNKEGFYITSFITSATAGTGGSYFTKDNGKTWYKNLDNNYLRSMDFYDAETGIVTIGRDANFNTNIFYFTENATNIGEANKISNSISIFPNPATNTLNLNISEDFSYSITNLQGQVIQYQAMKINSNSIDISKLPIGVYIINLTTETRNYYSKFIKTE